MCNAIINAGGRGVPGGASAASRSAAARIMPKARSLAANNAGLRSTGSPDSNIAQRGFEQFESALSEAWDDGRPDTVSAFERVGKAYLAFAREKPAFYSAMFESGLAADVSAGLHAAAERAFAVIRAAAERLAALAPQGSPRPPALMMALHIWSMSHGVASLFARGDAARRKLPMSAEELLEAEVLIYLRGLGFLADRKAAASDSVAPKPSGRPSGPWGSPK